MNLQAKVLLPILALIVMLMGASGALSYSVAKKNLTQALTDNMEGEAKAMVRSLDVLFSNSERDMARSAARPDVTGFFAGDIRDRQRQEATSKALQGLLSSYPDFERINIYDTEGKTVACSDPAVIGQSFADRDYFKAVKGSQKNYVSAPFRSRVSNASVVVVAVPVMVEGKLAGILTGNLSLPRFYKINVAPIKVGEDGYAFILAPDGLAVLHRDKSRELNKDWPDNAIYKNLVKKGQGPDSFVNAAGTAVQVYVETEPKSGMVAVVSADESDVYSGLIALRNYTLMAAGGGILLGFLIVFFLLRPVTRAVRAGADFASAIARGDLDSTLTVKRSDEIGVLAESLRAIPKVLKDIIATYGQLEKDVEEGRLDTQGDVSRFSGEYANLVRGTNSVMNRYRMVLDYIPSPVAVLSKDARVTYLNTRAQELAGSDYKGKRCAQLFAREDDGSSRCALKRSLETGKPASAETVAHPGGKTLDVSYSSIPILDSSGKVASVLQLITDLTSIKSAQRTMTEVAEQAHDISNRVAAASEELSSQVEQVSRGADMQRERSGSTASAMEEMNSTVMEVARSAAEASQQAESTRLKARSGTELVEKVISAINSVNAIAQDLQSNMQSLGKQAESIGGVMNVISDIADQTNLLALNAAIEAARAGEAGRGFAVVADEVRKLAEKTMSATAEVGGNIKGIQSSTQDNARRVADAAASVEEATSLAATSGEALHEILALVNKSTELVTGIATAAEQQSATSEEINRSVEEISRIADETASGMAHSSSSVQEIAGMSQELKRLLGRLQS